jgi:hypothetical protein
MGPFCSSTVSQVDPPCARFRTLRNVLNRVVLFLLDVVHFHEAPDDKALPKGEEHDGLDRKELPEGLEGCQLLTEARNTKGLLSTLP